MLEELKRQLQEVEAAMLNTALGGISDANAVAEWLREAIAKKEA